MSGLKLFHSSSLKNLHHLLVKDHPKFTVKIGCFGGRKYTCVHGMESETFHLNDLVKCLKNTTKSPKNEEDSFYVYNITKIVNSLDIQGNETLAKKNVFLRILTAVRQWWGNLGFSRSDELEIIRKDFSVPNGQYPLNKSQQIILDTFSQSPFRAGFYDVLGEVAHKKSLSFEILYDEFQNYLFKKWNHPHFKNEKEMSHYLLQNPLQVDTVIQELDSVVDRYIFNLQGGTNDFIKAAFSEALKNLSKKDLSLALDEVLKKGEKECMASILAFLALVNDEENLFFKFLKEDYVWPNEHTKDLVVFYTEKNHLSILTQSLVAFIDKSMQLVTEN